MNDVRGSGPWVGGDVSIVDGSGDPPGLGAPKAGPAETLGNLTAPVGPAALPPGAPALPPGAYGSPWYTDGPGCCGPVGRNGQIAYELHADTGPTSSGKRL